MKNNIERGVQLMGQIFIETDQDLDRLMAMMYLDFSIYSFEKTDKGIIIEFNDENKMSLAIFAERFYEWFKNLVFFENGDKFFENHPYKEKWGIWKEDARFVEAYSDEIYKAIILKTLKDIFMECYDYEQSSFELIDLINEFYELSKVRMEFIAEHFANNEHEQFIEDRIGTHFELDKIISIILL